MTSTNEETVTNGSTVTFSITGTGFASGATVSISGGFSNITVSSVGATNISVTVMAMSGNGNKKESGQQQRRYGQPRTAS